MKKYTAAFLIFLMLFFSSFPGLVKAMPVQAVKAVCKTIKNDEPCKQQNNAPLKDCNKQNCKGLLCCGTCGFIIAPHAGLSLVAVEYSNLVTCPFNIGELSAYHSNDWNPPKT